MVTRDNNAEDMALAPVTTTSTTPMPTLSPAASAGEPENIAVCIRVRPLNEREVRSRDCNVLRTISAMNMITITDVDGAPLSGKHNVFQYDHIFDETRSTRHMYNQVARRIVRSTLEGINGTIFAYGQTSSGKTYTMQGSDVSSDSSASTLAVEDAATSVGILQLAVDDIFAYIARCRDRDFLLRVSFVEIYNEIVRDLLVPIGSSTTTNNSGLKLREDPRKGVYVECREEIITSFDDILALLARGNDRRTVGQTAMNDRSSRSHSIFRIVIESKRKAVASVPAVVTATGPDPDIIAKDKDDDAVLVACLSLVDLAGSESVRHTAAEGIRQREAGNINKSLLTLSRVINALAAAGSAGPAGTPVSAQRQSAPFRDSKLTRLLQTSLAGNTRTLIVCCVTPSDRYLDETKSTLQFAARAKTITTSASVNEVLDDQAQLRRLQREVRELKQLVNTDALRALKAENAALVTEQARRQREYARLMGLILTSKPTETSDRTTGKRTRETWCPGDFPAALRRTSDGSASDHHSASPNHQPRRKRRSNSDSSSKENVMPMNLLSVLDDDDDDDDDVDGREDGTGAIRLRRQRRRASHSHAVAARLLGLLELALAHYRDGNSSDIDASDAADDLDAAVALVHEAVTRDEDQTRLADLLQELQALAADANETQHLRGESELQRMHVRELHRRLEQLGADPDASTNTVGSGNKGDNNSDSDDGGISESLAALQLELSAAQQQREQLTIEKQRAEADAAALAQQVETLRAELAEHQTAAATTLTEHQTALEAATDKHAQEIGELQETAAAARAELETRLTAACNETLALAAQIDALESELTQARAAPSTDASQTDSNDDATLAHELQRLLHEVEQAANEKRAADTVIQQLRTELEYAANERAARELNIQDLSAERAALADALRSVKCEMDELAAAASARTSESEQLETEVAELQRKLSAGAEELARLKHKLIELDDDKQALLATAAEVEPELQTLRTERETHASQVTALEQQLQTLREETDARRARRTEQVDTGTNTGTDTGIDTSNDESVALAAELREYEATVASQASAIEQLRAELALGDDDHAAQQQRVEKLEQELAEQTKAHESAVAQLIESVAAAEATAAAKVEAASTEKLEQFAQRVAELETERQRLEDELEQVSVQRRDLFEELSALESQLMDESQEKIRLTQTVATLETQLRDASASASAIASANVNANESDDAELARAKHAEAALLDELEQLTALMEKLEAENKALHDQLADSGPNSGSAAGTGTNGSEPSRNNNGDDDIAALQTRLEIEAELRATLELDVKSYEETLQVVRHELTGSSDTIAELLEKLEAMERDAAALQAAKDSADRDAATVRELLARAKEEQNELRYQQQQRARSAETTDRSLQDAVVALEAQLRDAQTVIESHHKRDVAAQQLEQTVADLQHELLAARKAVAVADDAWRTKLSASEQQLQADCKQLRTECEQLRTDLEQLRTENKQLQIEVVQLRTNCKQLRTEREQLCTEYDQLQATNRDLTQQLRDVDASWRQRESELSAQVNAELQTAQNALHALQTASKQALADQLRELETQWRAADAALRDQHSTELEHLREQHDVELERLREQCTDTQDALDAYTTNADAEIHKLRSALETSDHELQEAAHAAQDRDHELAELNEKHTALEHKLKALLTSRDDAVEQLTRELEAATAQCKHFESQTTEARESAQAANAAIEALESDAYKQRQAIDDLTDALQSAQLEAKHFAAQCDAADTTRNALEALVATQRERIAKLEQVKMTTETLALFRKLKRDREALQHQVAALETAKSELVDRHAQALAAARDAAQRDADAHATAVRELATQNDALAAEIAALKTHRSRDVTYLETTNLELLVANRQLTKQLDAHSRSCSHSDNALGAGRSLLDDDTLDASAAAAVAILAGTTEQPVVPTVSANASASTSSSRSTESSVNAFLRPTSDNMDAAADAKDTDARPACAQQ